MAAILCTRFPHKASELLAYQAAIVRAERNYEGTQWVSYDRRYRREALARKDLNWSVPDPRLYSEAFTGRAKTSGVAHSASRMTMSKIHAPEIPTVLCWVGSPHGRMANAVRHSTDGSSTVSALPSRT